VKLRTLSCRGSIPMAVMLWLLVWAGPASADQWRTLTDQRDVRDIIYSEGGLWCATSGGLTGFDIEPKRFESFTNIDGLRGIGLARLAAESAGGLWLMFDNRYLQRFQPGTGVTHSVDALHNDDKLLRLNNIAIGRRGVYVAYNIGIAWICRTDYDIWVWQDRYVHLGDFPLEEEVVAVAVEGDYLWAGTAVGIARGDLNSLAPLTWENFTTTDGLAGNGVRDIAVSEDGVFAATDGGISLWDGSGWSTVSNRRDITRLVAGGGTVLAVAGDGVYSWDCAAWPRLGTARNRITSVTADGQGRVWAGMLRDGLSAGGIALASDTGWVEYLPQGPATNLVMDMNFTREGDLLMVGGRGGGECGLSRWNGSHWQIWTAPAQSGRFYGCQSRSVSPDLDGGVWVGTFGGGIARFNPDGTVDFYDYSEETGSRLIGYEGHLNSVLASGLTTDAAGNVWVVNRSAADGNILICIPRDFIQGPRPDREWYYFHHSRINEFNYKLFEHVVVDSRGRKWLATTDPTPSPGQGVYAFDENGTLDDSDDDRSWGPIAGMGSPQVLSLVWDPAGYIWAGSIDGVYYLNADVSDPESERFTPVYDLRDEPVNAIAIDPAGNKWFGTNHGVEIRSPLLFQYEVIRRITTEPPDMLPNQVVRSISIDPRTGWAYIGTDEGTAALLTPYRDYGPVIEEVTVEPNPFNPNDGRMIFTGSSLANDASARIYTPDGRLVRRLSHDEAAIGWNGLDDHSRRVADGIYLILTNSSDCRAGQGKVAVIWE